MRVSREALKNELIIRESSFARAGDVVVPAGASQRGNLRSLQGWIIDHR